MLKMIASASIMSFLIISMSETASAQDLFTKKGFFSQFEPATENLQKVTAKQTIGGYPILQIGDEMRLVLSKVNYSTGVVTPLGRAYFVTTRDKKFHTALNVTANLESSNMSDWIDTPCKREDFLWKRSIGASINDVNCASINHLVNYFVNPTGDFQQIYRTLKDEEIEIPPTTITVTFTRYKPRGQRLVYDVVINPENYGIERDSTTVWGGSVWYKDFIKRDPKKIEFVEKLKKWATDVQDQIDAAFEKDANAFSNLKPLDDYLTPSESKMKNENSNNLEEKLVKLKSLYDKGLLTEVQYNDQVKGVLNEKR